MRGGLLIRVAAAAAVGVGVLAGPAQAAPSPYPKARGFVLDVAGELEAAEEAQLEDELKTFERRSGNEVAVLVVRSLDGRTVEAYATGVFNAWGIGKKDENNGILLLVAMKERKLRLEVGGGLGDVLDDEEATIILDDEVIPHMREGDVFAAVEAGLTAIYSELDAGADDGPGRDGEGPDSGPDDDMPYDAGAPPLGSFGDDGSASGDDGFGNAVGLLMALALPIGVVLWLVSMAAGGGGAFGGSATRRFGAPWSSRDSSSSFHDSGSSSFGSSSFDSGSSGGSSGGGDFGGGSSDGGGGSGGW